MTLQDIQIDVGVWSQTNFGNNQSKVNPDLALGRLAPLLGLGEELGEYFEAGTDAHQRDAIGDIGIFLCDYANRSGVALKDPEVEFPTREDPQVEVIIRIGQLMHANLKRQQGIRNFDKDDFFQRKQQEAIDGLTNALEAICLEIWNERLIDVINNTWSTIVKKRDWKNDPRNPKAKDNN